MFKQLPPRTYELRQDPIKMVRHVAIVALAIWGAWYSRHFLIIIFAAVAVIVTLVQMFQGARSLLATPRGITLRQFPRRPMHIPWHEVADINVTGFTLKDQRINHLWITLKETSPQFTRVKLPRRVAAALDAALPVPPPGSIPVDTADHDADEVARELKALRAEYVREGVLRDD